MCRFVAKVSTNWWVCQGPVMVLVWEVALFFYCKLSCAYAVRAALTQNHLCLYCNAPSLVCITCFSLKISWWLHTKKVRCLRLSFAAFCLLTSASGAIAPYHWYSFKTHSRQVFLMHCLQRRGTSLQYTGVSGCRKDFGCCHDRVQVSVTRRQQHRETCRASMWVLFNAASVPPNFAAFWSC